MALKTNCSAMTLLLYVVHANVQGFMTTALWENTFFFRFYWRFHGRNKKKINNNKRADKTKQKQQQNRESKKNLRQQNSPHR